MRVFLKVVLAIFFEITAANASTATITVTASGGNVTVAGSGTIDLTGLALSIQHNQGIGLDQTQIMTGFGSGAASPSAPTDLYTGATGPSSLGSGAFSSAFPTSGSGNVFGVNVFASTPPFIVVPQTYVSNTALSGTGTYTGTSLCVLGLTPGNYVYTWSGGSLTIQVVGQGCQPSPIPTLSEWAQIMMMLAIIATAGFYGWRMKR
jgi:hypothetical protein